MASFRYVTIAVQWLSNILPITRNPGSSMVLAGISNKSISFQSSCASIKSTPFSFCLHPIYWGQIQISWYKIYIFIISFVKFLGSGCQRTAQRMAGHRQPGTGRGPVPVPWKRGCPDTGDGEESLSMLSGRTNKYGDRYVRLMNLALSREYD
jgi:hypothetical protein